MVGVWLVCCALVADAVIGNVQEKALKEYKPSNSEMVGNSNVLNESIRKRDFHLDSFLVFNRCCLSSRI